MTDDQDNIGEFYKVRVCLPGSVIHLASRTEPEHKTDGTVQWDLITGTKHGDTVGFIDWTAVIALTWRKA